jgi:3-oxoacyl-[acyl-carrier-protein] synthase III
MTPMTTTMWNTTRSPFAPMTPKSDAQRAVLDKLEGIWNAYDLSMRSVPLFTKLYANGGSEFTPADYKALLRGLRPQVVEGSRWITRTASSITIDAVRSMFIGHAAEEHKDYQLLERDYVSVGGSLEEIQNAEKNVGGEALSGYIFNEATSPNPLHLLGAVFIIEGTGDQLMGQWATQLQKVLGLTAKQTSFFSYHGGNDENHVKKMELVLQAPAMTDAMLDKLLKAAKVVAAVYRLQYAEMR